LILLEYFDLVKLHLVPQGGFSAEFFRSLGYESCKLLGHALLFLVAFESVKNLLFIVSCDAFALVVWAVLEDLENLLLVLGEL
jgi:hypothetical protein